MLDAATDRATFDVDDSVISELKRHFVSVRWDDESGGRINNMSFSELSPSSTFF